MIMIFIRKWNEKIRYYSKKQFDKFIRRTFYTKFSIVKVAKEFNIRI